MTSTSLVHLVQQHLAVLETTVEAEDWSGPLVVRSGIDGRVANRNVAADRLLANRHLEPVAALQVDPETVLLDVVTSQSRVHIAMASRTRLQARRRRSRCRRAWTVDCSTTTRPTSDRSSCWRCGPGNR